MKKLLLTLILVVMVTITVAPTEVAAVDNYGGPCDMPQDNPMWAGACLSYAIMMDAWCASGDGEDWYCDTL